MRQIRVLVCDDSALMRRSLKKIIESDPELTVLATARDGEDSVNKARELKPDVITMDVNMPGMDGITALQIIMDERIAPVLMVSSLTQEGAIVTFEAMALGAFDYVPKPGGTVTVDMSSVSRELVQKIKAAKRPGVMGKLLRGQSADDAVKTRAVRKDRTRGVRSRARTGRVGFNAVALGISTGGPKTLFEVLPYLPKDLDAPVLWCSTCPANFYRPLQNG